MNKITKYYRDAVAQSTQQQISFKNSKFEKISVDDAIEGIIPKEVVYYLFDRVKEDVLHPVIIVLKTISTEFLEGSELNPDLEELTGILFLPAQVDESGKLYLPEEGKLPWIPRDFLTPIEEPILSIGNVSDYDNFFEESTGIRNQIKNFNDLVEYSKTMFDKVVNKSVPYKLDGSIYIFEDKTINATRYILELYNRLLDYDNFPLYQKITRHDVVKSKPLIDNLNISKMKEHCGQMNAEFPLSTSQRESLNHFNELEEGDVLAIKGPPGTGKTTLIQSVVASLVVKRALEHGKAPLIVASSTNNQAVTNIIDSFGNINEHYHTGLEERWITGVHSFATYFPSNGKKKEAREKDFQFTNIEGDDFFTEIESVENRIASKEKFLRMSSNFFNSSGTNLKEEQYQIHQKLLNIEEQRIGIISIIDDITKTIGMKSFVEFKEDNDLEISKLESKIEQYYDRIEGLEKSIESINELLSNWESKYTKLAWYIKTFKFIPSFQRQIKSWITRSMEQQEFDDLKCCSSLLDIQNKYDALIIKHRQSISEIEAEVIKDKESILNYREKVKNMEGKLCLLSERFKRIKEESKLHYDIEAFNDLFNRSNLYKLNDELDKIRYVEFWLAIHYFEGRWLIEDLNFSDNQKRRTFKNLVEKRYERISMISPCVVMTFFLLPKNFSTYNLNDKKNYPLYNYIDLLIVDEAGQISPEIASCSFALAKKALVLGDEWQIEPVWNVQRSLDIALAKKHNLITDTSEFLKLEKNGLNCSQSSLMKVACRVSDYDRFGKGLFLSEHRRCYNEIISYCNTLVYDDKLEPLRGTFNHDSNPLKDFLPPMGYKQISTRKSEKIATSRRNISEAKEISEWIMLNFEKISKLYKENSNEDEMLIGVITPFASQSNLIKRTLKSKCPELASKVSVGTVHTFQGAERKIIIFSSVYGSSDSCFMINNKLSLMNVAVSRAKDSFIVFGDRECLQGDIQSPAALLKEFCAVEIE